MPESRSNSRFRPVAATSQKPVTRLDAGITRRRGCCRKTVAKIRRQIREVIMYGMVQGAVAALSFALICTALPASAQETVRIRGTIERVEGPVYVVKNRDGAELKLTVTDNPLFVAIVKSTMADIKPGMFVGSAGMMQADGIQKAIGGQF